MGNRAVCPAHGEDKKQEQAEDDREFAEFCEAGFRLRENNEELGSTEECDQVEPGAFDKHEDLPVLFTLILICAYGAFVRAICKRFKIKIPYTVILLVSGFGVGLINVLLCVHIYKFTAIARIHPEHILYTFLPILIFESAFNIPVHILVKSLSQILILAFPGMIISCFATAFICQNFFNEYEWSFITALLFGCIISATDPVAVVAILKDLGVSENLGVLIDGESLMNDGVAIVLFEIFKDSLLETIDCNSDPEVHEVIIFDVLLMFFKIAGGAPLLGFAVGKVVIFLLSYVYNDAPVEIAATVCASYLTYWSSEKMGLSGVLAVVALGVTMSAERTVISPESEGPVHHFWEMLGYLANTVLFVQVGIVIAETALSKLDLTDFYYLIFLYVVLHIVRFGMLLIFYPVLRRLGYGLEWQNMMVIMWGGLRGAVGICLALEIYQNEILCDDNDIGPKFLFHTGGIVLLTLVINGTTTKSLLKVLKLTDTTQGQRDEMTNAIRRVRRCRYNMTRSFQMTTFFIGARWDEVEKICRVDNPYAEADQQEVRKSGYTLKAPRPFKDNTTICWNCANIVENEPTVAEYRQLTNDARLRAIKSMKIHYKHLFERGTLTEQATQYLLANAEKAEDKFLSIIQAQDFHKYMVAHGFYLWMREHFVRQLNRSRLPSPPRQKWRYCFYWLVTRDWFEYIVFTVTLFNIIVSVIDIVLIFKSAYPKNPCKWTKIEEGVKRIFLCASIAFVVIYSLEVIVKVVGLGPKAYFCSVWSYIDIITLIISYVDVVVSVVTSKAEYCNSFASFIQFFTLLRILKVFQIVRSIRLMKAIIPRVLRLIRQQTNAQMFIGYDMGKGFVETSDAVIKFVPQIAENKKVQKVLKQALKRERNACWKDLTLIHEKFPGVAVALKTRHACRDVLNRMAFQLNEVKNGGMLDDMETSLLKHILEEKMKRLVHSPTFIQPANGLTESEFEPTDERKSFILKEQMHPFQRRNEQV